MKLDSQVVRHAGWEMTLMRIAFAVMVWQSIPIFFYQTSLPHPTGMAHFVDLRFLTNPDILGVLRGVLAVALLFYVAGLFVFLSLGFMTFLLVACGSFDNSQGAINHSFQPMALAALAQWVVAGFFAIRERMAGKTVFFPFAAGETHRYLVHAAKVALVSCYVTSAFTKLERSDGEWISRTPNLAVAIAKTNAKSYLNAFEPTQHWARTALSSAAGQMARRGDRGEHHCDAPHDLSGHGSSFCHLREAGIHLPRQCPLAGCMGLPQPVEVRADRRAQLQSRPSNEPPSMTDTSRWMAGMLSSARWGLATTKVSPVNVCS